MFYGSTYGPLGGQVALGETQGQFSGWEKQGDLIEKDKQRKRLQEEWDIKKDKLNMEADLLRQRHEQITQMGKEASPTVESVSAETKQLQQQVQHMNKLEMSNMFTRFLGTDKPLDETKQLNTMLQQNPNLAQQLGLKNPYVELPSSSNPSDVDMMTKYLSKVDPEFGTMFKPAQDAMVKSMLDSNQFLKADGRMVDVFGMSAGMGIMNTMPADIKDKATGVRQSASEFWKQGKTEQSTKPTKEEAAEEANMAMSGYIGDEQAMETILNAYPQEGDYVQTSGGVKDSFVDTNTPASATGEISIETAPEHIKQAEGTTREKAQQHGYDSEYDITFGYGIYGNPDKPLTQMTIGEVLDFQKKMKQHPENNKWGPSGNQPTSAVGAGQFVEGTLREQAQKLGLSMDTKFTPEVQDAMMKNLYSERGTQPWEGFSKNPNYAGTPGPRLAQAGQMDWQSQPYQMGNQAVDDYRRALGIPVAKTNTTMTNELNHVASMLPPEQRTNGNVVSIYSDLKNASRRDSPTSLQKNRTIAENYAANEWGRGTEGYKNYMHEWDRDASTKAVEGVSGVKSYHDRQAISDNRRKYREYSKPGKGLNQMTQDEIYIAKDNEDQAEMHKTQWYKELDKEARGLETAYTSTTRVLDKFDEIVKNTKNGGVWMGPVAGAWKALDEYFSVGTIIGPEQEKGILDTLELDSAAGMVMAEFIKSMSGLAVTDTERQMYRDIMGLSNWKRPEILKTRLTEFQKQIGETGYSKANQLARRGAVGTGADYANVFNTYTPTGTATDQVTAAVGSSEPTEVDRGGMNYTDRVDFANKAKVGDTLTEGGITYKWNGTSMEVVR